MANICYLGYPAVDIHLMDRPKVVPNAVVTSQKSPLCLFPTRQSCQQFNMEMLSKLKVETKEIPCIDEVDETTGKFKWTQKAEDEMNADCNSMAGLEAVLQIAVGACVTLRRNIDTRSGLVNGAIGTVLSITTLPSSLTEYKHLAISSG